MHLGIAKVIFLTFVTTSSTIARLTWTLACKLQRQVRIKQLPIQNDWTDIICCVSFSLCHTAAWWLQQQSFHMFCKQHGLYMINYFSHIPPEGRENKMGMESWLFFTDMKSFVWSSLQMIFENSSSTIWKWIFFFSFAKQINVLFLHEKSLTFQLLTTWYISCNRKPPGYTMHIALENLFWNSAAKLNCRELQLW